MAATVEEQAVARAIREECAWEELPRRLQANFLTREEWHRRIVDYCIRKRLDWSSCFARKVSKEGEYYEEMMIYLRKNLSLFPYHLADYICRVMRVSPFRYYCDMLFEVMKNEQPYDSIPNFTAADALRLTGVGRNEFIDIMNKCRSKKLMWKLNKSIAKDMLPAQPVDFPIEPWWGVCLVNFTLEEFKKLTEEETTTIDKICKEEVNSFVLFEPAIINGLYKRGLVYFDVPVYSDDRFKVSRLEGFVSNREQLYEDPIEELLYAVFVVLSENATVAELAATLQADLSQLQAAASFACRLGWAVKLMDPDSVLRDCNAPGLPSSILSDDEEASNMSINSDKSGQPAGIIENEETRRLSGTAHVGFLVDANVTSYLMMGSISPGLKAHAVTLYEAGKLGDSVITELCKDLASLHGQKFEGELQEFANHAYSLRCILECLQSGGVASGEAADKDMDDFRFVNSSHDASRPPEISVEEGLQNIAMNNEGMILDGKNNDRMMEDTLDSNVLSLKMLSEDADEDSLTCTEGLSRSNGCTVDSVSENSENLQLNGPATDDSGLKSKRKYRVDVLRSESLAALAPATLERLFLRDYDIIVSMLPLPSSPVLPGTAGPIHFGPPSYSAMTPWMKLLLYTVSSCGPLSCVLMKGQRLRYLPQPLAACEKALIWSWDGPATGGLGGKFEGNLVKGNILLHCLNIMLKNSAVVVQPLSKDDLDSSGKLITMDIPLPLKNCDAAVASAGSEMSLHEEEVSSITSLLNELCSKVELCTVGYIRLLKLHKIADAGVPISNDSQYVWVPLTLEFGVPLFDTKLCERICERIVASHILQKDELAEHNNAMQTIRRRLRQIYTEYQATGPASKLFHQKGPSKDAPGMLLNYASGRWNPLIDPSTPPSRSSNENDRLKLATRRRGRSEVLIFDGNILRSYALAPGYETRPTDESATHETKPESDDVESKDVVLPGVNLLFDGAELHPFDIGACLQAQQPIQLIAEASAASAASFPAKASS